MQVQTDVTVVKLADGRRLIFAGTCVEVCECIGVSGGDGCLRETRAPVRLGEAWALLAKATDVVPDEEEAGRETPGPRAGLVRIVLDDDTDALCGTREFLIDDCTIEVRESDGGDLKSRRHWHHDAWDLLHVWANQRQCRADAPLPEGAA